MIYAISQIKPTTGLNPLFIVTGFFVAKNVGILFLNIIIIRMEEQESQNNNTYFILTKSNQIIRGFKFYKIRLNT